MRHQKRGRKLGRTASHRKAMMRNMVTSFFKHESLTTTVSKAKEMRRYAERMITFGKRGDLHARRQALRFLREKEVVKTLFDDIAPRFENRDGGYTRILKLGPRKGDGAELALIQLVEQSEELIEARRAEKERRRRHREKQREKEEQEAAAEREETAAEQTSAQVADAEEAPAETESEEKIATEEAASTTDETSAEPEEEKPETEETEETEKKKDA